MANAEILALEDVTFRYDLHRSLGSRTDVSLEIASSGMELLLMASQSSPDLLVLDHWMPDMLGDEVLERLRRMPHLSTTPVVILASDIGPEAGERCKNLGPTRLMLGHLETKHLVRELTGILRLRHRRQQRVAVRIPVTVRHKGIKVEGFTRDVSSLGASIDAGIAPPRGAMLEVLFRAQGDESGPIGSTEALVRHVRDSGSNPTFGVEFIEPSKELAEYLAIRLKEGQQLGDMISRIERLPALPAVAAKVLEESVKENVDLDTIVSMIRSDPSLTAYLLKMANAASYRFSTPVTTVERATTLMGLNAVRNSVLGFAIFRHLSKDSRDKLAYELWRHSLACALACEMLAPRFEVSASEAFTLGLLHDVGKFLLLSEFFRSDNGWAGKELIQHWSFSREPELFGMNHAEIGAAVLAHWRVPESIHRVVAGHHLSGQELAKLNGLKPSIQLVKAADSLTYRCHIGVENGLNDGNASLEEKVKPEEVEDLCSRVFRELSRIGDVFGMPVEPADLCAEIVERANLKLSTELRMAEERNELLRRAYERTRQNLVSLAQSEKFHAVTRLCAGVAHEINNPLAFSLSNLRTLQQYIAIVGRLGQEPAPAADQGELHEVLEDLPSLMGEMEHGLLRIEEVVRSLQHLIAWDADDSTQNLAGSVREAISLVNPSKPDNIRIELTQALSGKASQSFVGLVRAFVEIMLNSIAAMPEGGKLEINLRQEPGFVIVLFRDSGVGIAEDEIKHVFEPFYTTKPVGQGRGMGLSVAYSAVSKLQGQILINSTPGYGTVVEVQLPVQQTD